MRSEKVNVCAIAFVMTEHEGMVSFVSEPGFWGHKERLSFVRKSGLWCLHEFGDTITRDVPVAHIRRCHEILCERFGKEHRPCKLDSDEAFRGNE